MNKKLLLIIFIIILTLLIGAYLILNKSDLNKQTLTNPIATTSTIKYLVSSEDTTKYCDGENMDSAGYQKTITIEKSTTTLNINPTNIERIKEVISLSTTGMCRDILNSLDIKENNGTVFIPPIDGWAGVSITMCSCKPQVETNLLQIPGTTKIIWSFVVDNFENCVALGNPVMESYPRQCKYENKTFVENIGNTLEKIDLIKLETPLPNEIINSPLTIKGQARGSWFFEASFPVALTDWDGKIIAEGIAKAKNDWMTTDFVPFEATLKFTVDKDVYSNKGSLILRKDNPSGLSKNDDALEIPITIQNIKSATCNKEENCCAKNEDCKYISFTGGCNTPEYVAKKLKEAQDKGIHLGEAPNKPGTTCTCEDSKCVTHNP